MMLLRATGYSGPQDPTSADSVPDYDDWGPDEHWSAQDWQKWHSSLTTKYDKDTADTTFVNAYANAGVLEAITRARAEDPQFQAWARQQGLYDKLVAAERGFRNWEHYIYESGVAKYAVPVGLALGALLIWRVFFSRR
jgi:hypothetical protein